MVIMGFLFDTLLGTSHPGATAKNTLICLWRSDVCNWVLNSNIKFYIILSSYCTLKINCLKTDSFRCNEFSLGSHRICHINKNVNETDNWNLHIWVNNISPNIHPISSDCEIRWHFLTGNPIELLLFMLID